MIPVATFVDRQEVSPFFEFKRGISPVNAANPPSTSNKKNRCPLFGSGFAEETNWLPRPIVHGAGRSGGSTEVAEDGVFVTSSYDPSSHFEDASTEVLALPLPW